MIALIQRVKWAKVEVENQTVGEIAHGLLVLLGVEQGDTQEKSDRLLEKVLNYRIFSDEQGKMNLNVQQSGGSLLVVSQFTLAADTQKGGESASGERALHLLSSASSEKNSYPNRTICGRYASLITK